MLPIVPMLPTLLVAAIVVEDQAALRASPHESAPRQAVMWRGDWLEVRGERAGYLQVYDHRHERPGYVRPWQVRSYPVAESSAPALRAVMDFLRDTPGAESLGIGYAALYLRAAPAATVGSDAFDALGTMADRLARRASAHRSADLALAAHLDVATSYGVHFDSSQIPGKDRTLVCYDGEAFRRVLALPSPAAERARAALSLTRPECADPRLGPTEAQALNRWRLDVLEHADPGATPSYLGNRLRLRRATVLSDLVYQIARQGDQKGSASLSERAVRELALVNRPELLDEDGPLYDEVAVRVAAARWAAEPVPVTGKHAKVALSTKAGQPGQTCVQLIAQQQTTPLIERCTYGLVWAQSVRVAPSGTALTVAVQPLPGWVELWVFRRCGDKTGDETWELTTLTPAAVDPEVGYVELAGFSPDGEKLLVAREALVQGALLRQFQVLRTDTLAVERQARSADVLLSFRKWQSADWRGRTLVLR